MNPTEKQKLLRNRKVIEEINRHQWIESEKAGHDIGFDNAAADWLERFSTAWMQYHMPKKKISAQKFLNKIFPNNTEQ
jgi:hypothetical protein